MEDKLNVALAEIATKLSAGIDWSIAEAPGVVQEMLNLHRIEMSMLGFFAFAILTTAFLMYRYTRKNWDEIYRTNREDPWVISTVIVTAFGIIAFLIFTIEAPEVFFAPKWHVVNCLLDN